MQSSTFSKILATALLSCFLFSCGKGKVFSEYKSIDADKGWKKEDKITFEVNIEDVASFYNAYVNVRHADAYPFRNLYVFLTTEYPDGRMEKDTLECVLADEKNHWKGEGAGDLWDNSILLQSNMRFPAPGKYKFTYEHGMRIDPVPLILDMGLTIEKAQ